MPKNVASTNQLQVSSSDFVCTRENVLWLLGYKAFYKHCPSFNQLLPAVEKLVQYMQSHGFTGDPATKECKRCDVFRVVANQNVLLDSFAQILLWLNDTGRIQELQTLKNFVSEAKKVEFKRVILAYAGKATKKRDRLVIVE